MTKIKYLDTNPEFLIQPQFNGIKLVKPENFSHEKRESMASLGSFFKNSFSIFFADIHHTCQNMNETSAAVCGFDSVYSSRGKTAFDFATKRSAELAIRLDKHVIKNQKYSIVEQDLARNDGLFHQLLAIRAPWYDDQNQVIGIFGCSILLNNDPLADALYEISQLGFLHRIEKPSTPSKTIFSKREMECIQLTIQGKKAKEIAAILKLSSRTIENYLENIKTKLGVTSKLELIARFL